MITSMNKPKLYLNCANSVTDFAFNRLEHIGITANKIST